MSLHLSRIRLKDEPSTAALARLLLPEEAGARVSAGHRLMWSLFADGPGRTRDFLWREDGGGAWRRTTFLVLSRRPPADANGLFEIETKIFAPTLAAGQRLGFRLRASLSANEPRPGERRGKRIDPIARALRGSAGEERAARRDDVTQTEGAKWLARQGVRAGFRLAEDDGEDGPRPILRVESDDWRVIHRDGGAQPVRFPSVEFDGAIVVENPASFLSALAQGFGRAKAFGCGLMLIRRA